MQCLTSTRLDVSLDGQPLGSKSFSIRATDRKPAQTPGPREGRVYTHPAEFSFWYPADWTVKELPGALQLVPPNPATTPAGEPAEAYFILGDTVGSEAISRADDPRVVQYLDQAMARIAPALRRTAAPKGVVTGPGTVMNWEGPSPTGQPVGARAYVSIINNYGVALVARHRTSMKPLPRRHRSPP